MAVVCRGPPAKGSPPTAFLRAQTNDHCAFQCALARIRAFASMSPIGRLCCKSLSPLGIKNSPGCRRDFRVKMWGTSSPDDKLTGDLGNVIEARQSGGRRLVRVMAGKLSPGNFRLLQQYLPLPDSCSAADLHSNSSSARPDRGSGTLMPSALAVFRLMNSPTLVTCWTGRSAGFSPLRIRPV